MAEERRAERSALRLLLSATFGVALLASPTVARASCSAPANAIEAENCLPGTPQSTWDIPTKDAGDSTIQGFATDISVNRGSSISFKVKTTASSYRIDIYRMGYYQGNGARLITSLTPSARLPQAQPACLTDTATALIDCGNWAVSASWAVPANATSGIYFAKLVRTDTGGSSHIVFIVRNDASHSDILFQASDTTWQAYNDYGGENFYTCGTSPPTTWNSNCRAYKLSYNRPFRTRTFEIESWVFNSEYPMVRWLEANAYDVTYFTATDTDRNGALILNHKVWMSNGHDEYWSGNQRAKVEAARAAGVHLAFLSANTIYWKTRWESSIDASGTPYRTLVCYKETWANAVIDPADPPIWTGTWRDPRFSPPADGGRPENALAGTITRYAGGAFSPTAITVPQEDGRLRFWRNTDIATLAPGQTATLAPATIGDEVGDDEDNGFRPAGVFHVSTTPLSTATACLLDFGNTTGACSIIHSVTLYRYAGRSLVLSTATYHWAWGLDANHDPSSPGDAVGDSTDVRMQQATVNFLADMGAQPASLRPGLVPASASADASPPVSTVISPSPGTSLTLGVTVTVSGTASDVGGGVVGGMEVSTDGGGTWHPAMGRENWTYAWTASSIGTTTILSRAVDDSGNLEVPSGGVAVTVGQCQGACTSSSIWPATAAPVTADSGPDSAVELGVKFRSDVDGSISGIRFYKGIGNTGTHVGNLWSSAGTLLATATFANETASGWQQVIFSSPVPITANTVYVASYHTNVGHYSDDQNYFASAGVDSPPLHALVDGASGFNGLFAYGGSSSFPSGGWRSSNYWVDVVFSPAGPPAALSSITVTPSNPTLSTGGTQQLTATGAYTDGSTRDIGSSVTWSTSNAAVATVAAGGLATAVNAGTATISAALGGVTGSTTLSVLLAPVSIVTSALPSAALNASYSASLAASGGVKPYTWSIASGLPPGLTLNGSSGVISGTPTAVGAYGFTVQVADSAAQTSTKALSINVLAQTSLWSGSVVPSIADSGPDNAVELGVKFRSDVGGSITGIRFYKGIGNTGTHVANLWSASGALLATATFASETASGWQQVSFSSPVPITANTVYVASYHTSVGHYSDDQNYFASAGVDSPPLHALVDGASGFNGVFAYGSSSSFPSGGWRSSNYWVDVVFSPGP